MHNGTLFIGAKVTWTSCGLEKGDYISAGAGIFTFTWIEDDDNTIV
jgi:hypothetical protein